MPPSTPMPADEAARQAALEASGLLEGDADEAFDDIVSLAALVCAAPAATLTLVDGDRQWFKARVGIGIEETPRTESICARAIAGDAPLFEVHDVLAEPALAMRPTDIGGRLLRFYAGVPLRDLEGHALGTLCVMDHAPRTLSRLQRDALHALARQMRRLFELRRLTREQGLQLSAGRQATRRLEHERASLQQRHDDLQRVVGVDPLTGLPNRASLAQMREDPVMVARLTGAGYVLAIIDIDNFKQVNDRHGHLLGDKALRAVADVIADNIRGGDVAIRWGGEEFLMILPDTSLANGFEITERIRRALHGGALPFTLTVSAGLAAGDPARDTPERVFERADQALYRAKAGGRDRVVADES